MRRQQLGIITRKITKQTGLQPSNLLELRANKLPLGTWNATACNSFQYNWSQQNWALMVVNQTRFRDFKRNVWNVTWGEAHRSWDTRPPCYGKFANFLANEWIVNRTRSNIPSCESICTDERSSNLMMKHLVTVTRAVVWLQFNHFWVCKVFICMLWKLFAERSVNPAFQHLVTMGHSSMLSNSNHIIKKCSAHWWQYWYQKKKPHTFS